MYRIFFLFQADAGIRYSSVNRVKTCAVSFSSRRRHTRFKCDWSSDVCSSDLHLNLVCRLLLEKKKHTSELQPHLNRVFRLLLEKKKSSSVNVASLSRVHEGGTLWHDA